MDKQQELIEIYKLHVQLADSVSNRRTTTNRFYMLVLSGLAVIFSALLQRKNGVPLSWLTVGFGLLGISLAAAWCVVIRSYRQLNSRKFKALQKLEEKLAYPFFEREWELLGKGKERKTYWELSVVEMFVPTIFFIGFTCALGIGIYQLENKYFFLLLVYPLLLIATYLGTKSTSSNE